MTTKKLEDLMIVAKIMMNYERFSCECPCCKRSIKSKYRSVFYLKRLEHYIFDESVFKVDNWIDAK